LAAAEVIGSRACARPLSPDGYPLVGLLGEDARVWVATGNDPWDLNCGPATARVAVDALLGRAAVPRALAADRWRR
jgi:glycine/D-amino acid oxidase-like deaminating enzyme